MSRKGLRASGGRVARRRMEGRFSSYVLHLRRRNYSPRTIGLYDDCLRRFRRWMRASLKKDLRRLSAEDLRAFQVWLSEQPSLRGGKLSAGAQAYHLAVVKGFFAWLRSEREVLADPAKALRYPRQAARLAREVLGEEELGALLATTDESLLGLRDRVLLRLLAFSGPRVAELVKLDAADLDLEAREITVRRGKGAKDRLLFFDTGTRVHLARYLVESRPRLARAGEQALFVTVRGGRLSVRQLQNIVRKRAEGAGIVKTVSPHSLRHTFCTLMLRHGANLRVIAELAGHDSVGTTARYTRLEIGELSDVLRSAHPRGGEC